MFIAMLLFVGVHLATLWLFTVGFPFGGWSGRSRIRILGGLFIVEVVAVIAGLFLDDPRDAWSVPASASMLAWISDYLRMLWD